MATSEHRYDEAMAEAMGPQFSLYGNAPGVAQPGYWVPTEPLTVRLELGLFEPC